MISLHNIARIEDFEDHLFKDDINSPYIKQKIMFKEDDEYNVLRSLNLEHEMPRYGIFIDEEECKKLNDYSCDCHHYFKFKNYELYVILDEKLEFGCDIQHDENETCDKCYVIDCDNCENYPTYKMPKYKIEGFQGYFWLIIANHFFIYGDLPL